jgi:hypothetical protein
MGKKIIFVLLCIYCLWSIVYGLWSNTSLCYAKEITFEAAVDKNRISTDENITLELTFHGTQSVPSPEITDIEGFHVRYVGPSTMMSIVNGRASTSITHRYVLIPLQTGTFTIGPFELEYKDRTYISKAMTIDVSDRPVARRPRPRMPQLDKLNLKDDVFLVIEVAKTRAYINEIVPAAIKLYVNRRPIRDIQYPQLEHEGFSVGTLGQPRQYQERVGGVLYDVMEFTTPAFGTRAGSFVLGPAKLTCNLVIRKKRRSGFFDRDDFFDDFFARYERYPLELTSKEVSMEVLPLPAEGKPKDFNGATGNFGFRLQAEPKEVKVGDPITLRAVVRGDGNFNTVVPPALSSRKNFKIYEPTVTQEDGTKVFEQVIIPKTDTVTEIPELRFSFFDPTRETYRTITRGPVPITVTRPEKQETLTIVDSGDGKGRPLERTEILGRDIIYIKENVGTLRRSKAYLYRNKTFLFSQLLPLACLISIVMLYRRKERFKTDVRYARRLTAFKKAKKAMRRVYSSLGEGTVQQFYDTVFKTIQEYLGDRFHIAPGGITADVVDGLVRQKNIDEHVLTTLRDIFRDCDMVRYAPSQFEKGRMEETVKKLEQVIGYLEKLKL